MQCGCWSRLRTYSLFGVRGRSRLSKIYAIAAAASYSYMYNRPNLRESLLMHARLLCNWRQKLTVVRGKMSGSASIRAMISHMMMPNEKISAYTHKNSTAVWYLVGNSLVCCRFHPQNKTISRLSAQALWKWYMPLKIYSTKQELFIENLGTIALSCQEAFKYVYHLLVCGNTNTETLRSASVSVYIYCISSARHN